MRKRIGFIVCVLGVSLLLGSCGKSVEKEQVSLRLWGSEGEQECLTQMVENFKEHYKEEAEFDIHVGVQDAAEFKNNYLGDVENSADVFEFPNDQLYDLVAANSLLPITWDTENAMAENGGADETAIQSATSDGTLYAYPLTASNGYFMFYNKKYFNEEDVQSFERILEVAEENGKKVYMDWSSGWYIYSFFGAAGFELRLSDNRLTNICNWNEKVGDIKGTDVAQAMLDISSSKAFVSGNNDEYCEGVEKGKIIAGVSGTWNVEVIRKAYGENYDAVKMPTCTIKGKQLQMSSFSGYKLVGVNATTKEPEWAQKLARWITNEESQKILFEARGEGPSNVKVGNSESVQSAPAIAALQQQREFSVIQNVGENFWGAATSFGMVMASGNKDKLDLQSLLNDLVEETEKPIEK